jgi:hypothetical protein
MFGTAPRRKLRIASANTPVVEKRFGAGVCVRKGRPRTYRAIAVQGFARSAYRLLGCIAD